MLNFETLYKITKKYKKKLNHLGIYNENFLIDFNKKILSSFSYKWTLDLTKIKETVYQMDSSLNPNLGDKIFDDYQKISSNS